MKQEQKFAHGTEVRFDCVQGQKRSWKIVCSNGRWVGLSLGCDENGQPQEIGTIHKLRCQAGGRGAGTTLTN